MIRLGRFALWLIVPLATGASVAAAQTQSQQQTQNNGSTYQSQYQVNGQNGAGQGSGTGNNQAQADYNASASLRSSRVSPQGSVQTQTQSLETFPAQTSTTRPPRSEGTARAAPQ